MPNEILSKTAYTMWQEVVDEMQQIALDSGRDPISQNEPAVAGEAEYIRYLNGRDISPAQRESVQGGGSRLELARLEHMAAAVAATMQPVE